MFEADVAGLASADPDGVDPHLVDLLAASVPRFEETSTSARVSQLWSRSIKAESQYAALHLAARCVDLTSLEGTDTPERVRILCAKAAQPYPGVPRPAAVCVFPDLVGTARASLVSLGSPEVGVAAVATGFPSGRTSLEVKLAEVAAAVAAGADEVDMVIDRAALLAGRYHQVFAEIRRVRQTCGRARLKTILETGELGSLDMVAKAAAIACWAGSDFVKTSTGKIAVGATPQAAYVLTRIVGAHAEATGVRVGVKVSGGVRSAKDAVRYLVLAAEVAGEDWLCPEAWRFGASGLLNDLAAQLAHLREGRYLGPDEFSLG